MDNIFILDNSADELELKDAIFERLTKVQAVTSCLLVNDYAEANLSQKQTYGVIWAINGILEEIKCLFARLDTVVI